MEVRQALRSRRHCEEGSSDGTLRERSTTKPQAKADEYGCKQGAVSSDNGLNAVAGQATTGSELTQIWRAMEACGEENNANLATSMRSFGQAQLARKQSSEDA